MQTLKTGMYVHTVCQSYNLIFFSIFLSHLWHFSIKCFTTLLKFSHVLVGTLKIFHQGQKLKWFFQMKIGGVYYSVGCLWMKTMLKGRWIIHKCCTCHNWWSMASSNQRWSLQLLQEENDCGRKRCAVIKEMQSLLDCLFLPDWLNKLHCTLCLWDRD